MKHTMAYPQSKATAERIVLKANGTEVSWCTEFTRETVTAGGSDSAANQSGAHSLRVLSADDICSPDLSVDSNNICRSINNKYLNLDRSYC